MKTKRVLIKFNHGLGDAVQLSAVLKNLRRQRPDWQIDVLAAYGKHSCFQGLCNASYYDPSHIDETSYERTFDLKWWECDKTYSDWPSTKVERCLIEVFDVTPKAEDCVYEMTEDPKSLIDADKYYEEISGRPTRGSKWPVVLIHYQGNTAVDRKNINESVMEAFCEYVISWKYIPVILDWDSRSGLIDNNAIFCPDKKHWLWDGKETGDAQKVRGLIRRASLAVMIDSGPQKVAATTDTPTIALWVKHHPLFFYAPAKNVFHLTAEGGHDHPYFLRNYQFHVYVDLETHLCALAKFALQHNRWPKCSDELPSHEIKMEKQAKFLCTLHARSYARTFYEEHKNAGLDYLAYGKWQEEYGQWITEAMQLRGKTALDVGCACGSIARGFRNAGMKMAGVDLSEFMIQLGRKEWADSAFQLEVADAINLHMFADGQFEFLHTAQVAEHWKPELVPFILKELARVTSRGGLLFCVLDTEELFSRQGRSIGGDEDPTHSCIMPLGWWRELLEASGWTLCTDEFKDKLARHPKSYLNIYDWDWFIARKKES